MDGQSNRVQILEREVQRRSERSARAARATDAAASRSRARPRRRPDRGRAAARARMRVIPSHTNATSRSRARGEPSFAEPAEHVIDADETRDPRDGGGGREPERGAAEDVRGPVRREAQPVVHHHRRKDPDDVAQRPPAAATARARRRSRSRRPRGRTETTRSSLSVSGDQSLTPARRVRERPIAARQRLHRRHDGERHDERGEQREPAAAAARRSRRAKGAGPPRARPRASGRPRGAMRSIQSQKPSADDCGSTLHAPRIGGSNGSTDDREGAADRGSGQEPRVIGPAGLALRAIRCRGIHGPHGA